MKTFEDHFDINSALFDCGSMLTFFRTKYDKDKHNVLRLESKDQDQFKHYFPNFSHAIKSHLKEDVKMCLIFWHRGLNEGAELQDEIIKGPGKIFIVNASKEAKLKPGTLLELEKGDEVFFPYKDYAYGFVFTLEESQIRPKE